MSSDSTKRKPLGIRAFFSSSANAAGAAKKDGAPAKRPLEREEREPEVVLLDSDDEGDARDSRSAGAADVSGVAETPAAEAAAGREDRQEQAGAGAEEPAPKRAKVPAAEAAQGSSPEQALCLADEGDGREGDDGGEVEVRLNVRKGDEADEAVLVAPELARILKPHQVDGVRFAFRNLIGSLSALAKGRRGGGCILAHSMGLGKTLQAVTIIRTLLLNPTVQKHASGPPASASASAGAGAGARVYQAMGLESGPDGEGRRLRNCIVVCPVNVLANWRAEFIKWDEDSRGQSTLVKAAHDFAGEAPGARRVHVELLDGARYKTLPERAACLRRWRRRDASVLLIGYDMLRRLVELKGVRRAADRESIRQCLCDPGPDLVVLDEGHVLKNVGSGIAAAVQQLKTRRRLVLTGTPLQNNLGEYQCMVDCVRPGFLGGRGDFSERFEKPIRAGQHRDATRSEVRTMRRRAHALRKRLEKIVHRRGVGVLREALPPLRQHVLVLDPTAAQEALVAPMLEECRRRRDLRGGKGSGGVLQVFQRALRACNHPAILVRSIGREDGDAGASEGAADGGSPREKALREAREAQDAEEYARWRAVMEGVGGDGEDLLLSAKMAALREVLGACAGRGEKALVFSQSLCTLDFLEEKLLPELGWRRGAHYARIDGATAFAQRQSICNRFNREAAAPGAPPADPARRGGLRCCLISTRAGNMGINLVGATHVVLLDVSWNPANDSQAIFRAYRYGQTKAVQVYRLVTARTLEHRVYKRQVAKSALSLRIVDDSAAQRHYNRVELEDLFADEPDPPPRPSAAAAAAADRDAGVASWSVLGGVLKRLRDAGVGVRCDAYDALMEEDDAEKLGACEALLAERLDGGELVHAGAVGEWEVFRPTEKALRAAAPGDAEARREVFFSEGRGELTTSPPEDVLRTRERQVHMEATLRRRQQEAQERWQRQTGQAAAYGAGLGGTPIPEEYLQRIQVLDPSVRKIVLEGLFARGFVLPDTSRHFGQ